MLKEKSIKELSRKIESDINPVPAGASTAAATALLGVSLQILLIHEYFCLQFIIILTD